MQKLIPKRLDCTVVSVYIFNFHKKQPHVNKLVYSIAKYATAKISTFTVWEISVANNA